MIPTIGLMIGSYIVLRCLDILSRPASAFSSSVWQSVASIAAMLVMVFAVYSCYELATSAGNFTKGLP